MPNDVPDDKQPTTSPAAVPATAKTALHPPARSRYGVYVVACADGSLYCGLTNRLEVRLAAHNSGRGARYTRARGPVHLRWWWECRDAQDARRLEALLKRHSRRQKERIIAGDASTLLPLLAEVATRRR